MPCNSVSERPSFCNEDASSGQRKARREARRKARVSGGRAFSACRARSSASCALLSSWPVAVSPTRARCRCRDGDPIGFAAIVRLFLPSTVRIHNGDRFASPMMDQPCQASLSFSKPGALRRRSLSMSSTATFWDRSKLSASQGIAKCRSPTPRNPPNERMA